MRNSPNYQEMYVTLFRAVTKTIEQLQAAQIDCEELFIAAEETAAETDTEAPSAARRLLPPAIRATFPFMRAS